MSERYRTARLVQRRIESISKDSLQLVGELRPRRLSTSQRTSTRKHLELDFLGRWLTDDLRRARESIKEIREMLEQLGEGEDE